MTGKDETSAALLAALRPEARESPDSGIYAVIRHGLGREGLVRLWVGEGDLPTPRFIADAAADSLRAGETFYTQQRGVPELRQALARYHERHYGRAFPPERFFVTGSGMMAVQIAVRLVAGAGDEVVVPTPTWPNIAAAIGIGGAVTVPVPQTFAPGGWRLDLDRLFAAVGPRTKALFINTPANPTAWVATDGEISAIVAFAEKRGLWIIADEVYHRFFYAGRRAPSFYDHVDGDARVLFVNTFSKNWAMTGWRVGWLSAPPVLGDVIENLTQYSTTGVAVFMQRAAMTALDEGEGFVAEQVARARAGRDLVVSALQASGRARLAVPDGAFYLMFGIDGEDDAEALALRLVDEAGVGLAPGPAFGPGGEGFLRLCYAKNLSGLEQAMERLTGWLARR